MTAAPPPIHVAWSQVMADVQAITKDGRNASQGFNFRGIDGVMNATGPALRKHGVVIVPVSMRPSYRDVEVGAKRTAMREVTMSCRWRIIGPAGDHLDVEAVGEAMDAGDKGTAKAASVAYRTMLLQALTAPTHQPDPDEQVYERATIQQPRGPLTGPPQTPGEHGHADALNELHRIIGAWPKDGWQRAHMAELREAKGWPKTLAEYSRSQVYEARAAARTLDEEPWPVDPAEVSGEVLQGAMPVQPSEPPAGGLGAEQIDELGDGPSGSVGGPHPAPVDNPDGSKPARTRSARR
jgi:hypothetical protein